MHDLILFRVKEFSNELIPISILFVPLNTVDFFFKKIFIF